MRSGNRTTVSTLLSRSRTALFNAISSPISTTSPFAHNVAPSPRETTDESNMEQKLPLKQPDNPDQGEKATPDINAPERGQFMERHVSDNQNQSRDSRANLHTYLSSPGVDAPQFSSSPVDSPQGINFASSIPMRPTVSRHRPRKTGSLLCSTESHSIYLIDIGGRRCLSTFFYINVQSFPNDCKPMP